MSAEVLVCSAASDGGWDDELSVTADPLIAPLRNQWQGPPKWNCNPHRHSSIFPLSTLGQSRTAMPADLEMATVEL
jgi:hypothetical protein